MHAPLLALLLVAQIPELSRSETGRLFAALEDAKRLAKRGDDAGAAAVLREQLKPGLEAKKAERIRKALTVYEDRARWSAEGSAAGRRRLLQSLLAPDLVIDVDSLSPTDERVQALLGRVRAEDPEGKALAPRPVQLVLRAAEGVPESVQRALIGSATESLRSIGFQAGTEPAPDVLTLDLALGPTEKPAAFLAGAVELMCSIRATGEWHAGSRSIFPVLNLARGGPVFVGVRTCQEHSAKEGGGKAALEVLLSWLRQNP